jgi:hypothetical protein
VALRHLQRVLKKKTTIFILSDFFDSGYEKALRQLGSKHDVVSCIIKDPAEHDLPRVGLIEVQDAESGEMMSIDTADASVRKKFQIWMKSQATEREKALRQAQADKIEISTHGDFVVPLVEYFRRRGRR